LKVIASTTLNICTHACTTFFPLFFTISATSYSSTTSPGTVSPSDAASSHGDPLDLDDPIPSNVDAVSDISNVSPAQPSTSISTTDVKFTKKRKKGNMTQLPPNKRITRQNSTLPDWSKEMNPDNPFL
jgi:hypothetical protein